MSSLRISLASVSDAGLRINVETPGDALRPEGAESAPLKGAHLRGTLMRLDEDFLLRGHVTGVFVRPCDRCLREVVQMVELEVDWFFEEEQPGGAFEDIEKYTFHGHELDLAPYMWEELVLAMPAKCVCEDKAGCVPAEAFAPPESGGEGAENVGAPMNPGFAKLKDMFPDIAREQRKE